MNVYKGMLLQILNKMPVYTEEHHSINEYIASKDSFFLVLGSLDEIRSKYYLLYDIEQNIHSRWHINAIERSFRSL